MAGVSPREIEPSAQEAAAWFYRNSRDGFAVAKDGFLVSANRAWCAINQTPLDAAIGGHLIKVVYPADRPAFLAAAARLEEDGEIELEHRIRRADGDTVWVRSSVKRQPGGIDLIVVQDVTAERRQREEIERKAKVADLLRGAAGVFPWTFYPDDKRYVFDSEFDIRTADGVSGAHLVSTAEMTAAVHPEDREAFAAAFYPSLKTGEAGQFWYRHLRGDGTWARFRAEWRGLTTGQGGKWITQGLTQDMTELAEARDAAIQGEQAAREAMEIKSQFLANMSHEFRTPLNGVLGVLHLLKDEALSPAAHALIGEAVHCGATLTELLNDTLDFANIEAGRVELKPEPTDIAALIDGVCGIVRLQAEAKGLELVVELEADVGRISVDPVRLRQMLFHLAGNAVKFTSKGHVCIRLTSVDAGDARRVRVEIQDTGIGMSPETQATLFGRFHQADRSNTRQFGGAGIGLAITQALVGMMGGEVTLDSAVGRGSTFRVEIPGAALAAPEAAPADEGACLDGLRLLVVEDNPTNRLVATRILENLGAAVETAENGALGVEAVVRGDFDLVFMDIQMPVMDGIHATRAIRALPSPAGEVPIIALTANVMAHQVREYFSAGMNGVVAKPLSPAAIIGEIAKLAGEEEAEAVAA